MRLENFDYNSQGAYFITICTKDKKKLLGYIVGAGVLDCPKNILSQHGKIADKYIKQLDSFYDNISVDKYVIMPNHIHLLITVSENGQSGTPAPTKANSSVAKFVSTFKRFANKEYGHNIWQSRYYDHIIRNQNDFADIGKYIDDNPHKWCEDDLYSE